MAHEFYIDKTFYEYYTLVRFIGSGAFGRVVFALDNQTGFECAVKILEKKNFKPKKLNDLRQEAEILSQLNHKNIVKFYNYRESETCIFIAMKMIHNGTLNNLLKQCKKLNEQQAKQVMKGLLQGVQYIHDHNIVHRDIKPANLLLSRKNNLESIKISDFGLSSQIGSDRPGGGTLIYMAPEQKQYKDITKAVDIWSCGIILYIILTGNHPIQYQNLSKEQYFNLIQNPEWKFPKDFPKLAKNLFSRMMDIRPLRRYSASQALNHPWITQTQTRIPQTIFESMQELSDNFKLKNIFFSYLFLSKFVKVRQKSPARLSRSFTSPITAENKPQNTSILQIKPSSYKRIPQQRSTQRRKLPPRPAKMFVRPKRVKIIC